MALKCLVTLQNQFVETLRTQQEFLFVPKERDGLQTLDPELPFPSPEMPCAIIIGQGRKGQDHGDKATKIH